MKGQSPAEFIIVTFLFLLLIVSIFTTLVIKVKPEFEKAKEQTSCLKANGLAISLLKEPGQPANWSGSEVQYFGLTNGTRDFISYNKWLAAKTLGFVNLVNKSIPDTSYRLDYKIYAFNPNMTDVCPAANNATVICRFNSTLLTITAGPSLPANLSLKLFFPLTAATQSALTLEPNDVNTSKSANGTIIELNLRTSASDSDSLNITFGAPQVVFIQEATYLATGGQALQIFLGNTSAVETFGSAGTGANSYCEAERAAILVNSKNETMLAKFNILTW